MEYCYEKARSSIFSRKNKPIKIILTVAILILGFTILLATQKAYSDNDNTTPLLLELSEEEKKIGIKSAYYSSEDEANLNGQYRTNPQGKEERIVCRHLAYSWAMNRFGVNDNYESVNTADKLKSNNNIIFEAEYSILMAEMRKNDHYYFSLHQFHLALEDAVVELLSAPDKLEDSYIVQSYKHIMALRLQKEGHSVNILFYDPNDTLRHKIIKITNFEDIKHLSLNHILSYSYISLYWPKEQATGIMININSQKNKSKKFVHDDDYSYLHYTLYYGHTNQTVEAVEAILGSHLSSWEKTRQLMALSKSQAALTLTFFYGHNQTLLAYIEKILSSQLSEEQKTLLIAGAGFRKINGLLRAIQQGYKETIQAYINAVDKSTLSQKSKVYLISGLNVSAIEDEDIECNSAIRASLTWSVPAEAAIQYIKSALNTALPDSSKIEILTQEKEIWLEDDYPYRLVMDRSYKEGDIGYLHDILNSPATPEEKLMYFKDLLIPTAVRLKTRR